MNIADSGIPGSKRQNRAKKDNLKKLGLSRSWLATLVIPTIILFFVAGVYLGSIFVHANGSKAQSNHVSVGLPGTNNVIVKEKTEEMAVEIINPIKSVKVPSVVTTSLRGAAKKRDFHFKAQQIESERAENAVSVSATSSTTKVENSKGEISSSLSSEFDLKYSLHISSRSFMKASAHLDSEHLVIGAWIYLDPDATNNNMRTVFSNKLSGCGTSDANHGFAVYVNEWQGSDMHLYVEYGGVKTGCNKLKSNVLLQVAHWYCIAYSIP